MRTTVDVETRVLERAKRLARRQGRTLGAVVSDALRAYLGAKKTAAREAPFEVLVRGRPGAHAPTAEEMAAVEDAEQAASLGGVPRGRRAAS